MATKNLLDALVNISKLNSLAIGNIYKSKNRMNNMGEALEMFVQDAFANTFDKPNQSEIDLIKSQVFSYLGNQNNPPDAILRDGDAIEIKKAEGIPNTLALNSSYPKDKLRKNSSMITTACKNCEQWDEKDIVYAIGVVKENTVNALCFVYGLDFAASYEVYEKIRTNIRAGVNLIHGVEFSDTKEFGRVNKVDPLGITYLRIRGMWGIESPFKVFNYLDIKSKFFAIINNEKYASFPVASRKEIESAKGIKITNCKIKNPNNPAQLIDAKLICFR